jgi:hypothetical protein
MDSRSRQNHRSKKSWVPNVEINPLGPGFGGFGQQYVFQRCGEISLFKGA